MISLNELIRNIGYYIKDLEDSNIDICESTSGLDVIYDNNNRVIGIKTLLPNGKIENIYSKYIILSEGAKGTCTRDIINKYNLDKDHYPATYGLGIKEVWEVEDLEIGNCIHTFGYPINKHEKNGYGGGFIYTLKNNIVQIGYVYNFY